MLTFCSKVIWFFFFFSHRAKTLIGFAGSFIDLSVWRLCLSVQGFPCLVHFFISVFYVLFFRNLLFGYTHYLGSLSLRHGSVCKWLITEPVPRETGCEWGAGGGRGSSQVGEQGETPGQVPEGSLVVQQGTPGCNSHFRNSCPKASGLAFHSLTQGHPESRLPALCPLQIQIKCLCPWAKALQ